MARFRRGRRGSFRRVRRGGRRRRGLRMRRLRIGHRM